MDQLTMQKLRGLPRAATFSSVVLRCVHLTVGLILIASAMMKMVAPFNSASGLSRLLPSETLQWMLMGLELYLGIALVSFTWPKISHLLATVFFSFSTLASLWMVWVGVSDCGCFGRISMNPSVVFAFDTTIAATLLLTRPVVPSSVADDWSRAKKPMLSSFAAVVTVSSVILVLSLIQGISPSMLRGRIQGNVTVHPARVSIGAVSKGKATPIDIAVCNNSPNKVKIVGGTDGCDAWALTEFPVIVPPKSEVQIALLHGGSGSPGFMSSVYTVFVDDGSLNSVSLQIDGEIE